MLLGRKAHTAGDDIRYVVDYSMWLEEGDSLASGTVAFGAGFTAAVSGATIGAPVVTPSNHLVFMLSGGTANEVFTLDVHIVNSRGEEKNDTLEFYVVAP